MSKLYYPTADELRGDQPLYEQHWFMRYQHLLVGLANTNEGRDLLCIDPWRKVPYPVVAVKYNCVKFYLGRYRGRDWWRSDFRVGAKWGNVIRYRWRAIQKVLDKENLRQLLAWPPVRLPNGRLVPVLAGGTHTTYFPQPDPETTTVDGVLQRNIANPGAAWATLRAGAGTNAFPSIVTAEPFLQQAATTTDQYTILARGIFLFDTSDIPDTDTKDSATLSLFGTALDNGLTSAMVLNLVSSNPFSNTDLTITPNDDYATARFGTTKFVTGGKTHASWSTTAYNDFTLNADGLTNISLTGISKFGSRSDHDIDNVAPGGPFTANQQDHAQCRFADQTGTAEDPKLVVTHTAPTNFIPRAVVF